MGIRLRIFRVTKIELFSSTLLIYETKTTFEEPKTKNAGLHETLRLSIIY